MSTETSPTVQLAVIYVQISTCEHDPSAGRPFDPTRVVCNHAQFDGHTRHIIRSRHSSSVNPQYLISSGEVDDFDELCTKDTVETSVPVDIVRTAFEQCLKVSFLSPDSAYSKSVLISHETRDSLIFESVHRSKHIQLYDAGQSTNFHPASKRTPPSDFSFGHLKEIDSTESTNSISLITPSSKLFSAVLTNQLQ